MPDMVVQIFNQFSDGSIHALPANSILFRGGGRDEAGEIVPRAANIFLSTNNRTCQAYASSWLERRYLYIYRAVLLRKVFLAKVISMQECTRLSLDALRIPPAYGIPWQRDELLGVARRAMNNNLDGIYF
jgi:hypothetical protein